MTSLPVGEGAPGWMKPLPKLVRNLDVNDVFLEHGAEAIRDAF